MMHFIWYHESEKFFSAVMSVRDLKNIYLKQKPEWWTIFLNWFFCLFFSLNGKRHQHLIAALLTNYINSKRLSGATTENIHGLQTSLCFPISHSRLICSQLMSVKSAPCLAKLKVTDWRNWNSPIRATTGTQNKKNHHWSSLEMAYCFFVTVRMIQYFPSQD